MADDLWDELQNMELGRDDPELFIPYLAYEEAVDRNRLSILARPLNPTAQNLFSVVSALPRSWGLTSRVHGRVIDSNYVQFLFNSEVDLLSVQRREPWRFNHWFVASQRWEDYPAWDFLTTIDLWVQIRGIPLPYVSSTTVRIIAESLGQVIALDFQDTITDHIRFIRVRVRFGVTDSLRFFRRIRFESGERALVSFQYERLRRICSHCFRLTHHRSYCPYLLIPRHSPEGPDLSVNGHHEVMDEMNRSDLNSQSQLSDSSLASPISQPPQMSTPPADYDDMSEALPSFHGSSADDTDVFTVPGPRPGHRRRHLSEHSHSSLHSDGCVPSMGFTNLEPGESSKRKSSSASPTVSDQRLKKKYPGIIITESQLPPKKR